VHNRAVMRIHSSDSVEEYARAVAAFLEAQPCARNVLLSIVLLLRTTPDAYSAPISFWWVTDGDAVVGAASWTPPWNLLVSSLPPPAASELAGAVSARAGYLGLRIGGVNGPADAAHAVAGATGHSIARVRPMLMHELEHPVEVAVPPGSRRIATPADVPLLGAWLDAFSAEVEIYGGDSTRTANRMVREHQFELWVDADQPVCLVGHHAPVGHVVRIGPVYTPPEHRAHGYARRLTYEVSIEALARPDVDRCMLFTDADNLVSNSIYRQAGYVPRGEHVEIEFT
jgi:predicted GNAT family acetyltransferase